MKKILFFTNKEDGFYLPYVLFVVSIVFIILTAHINMYSQEITLTQSHTNQLKIETLLQMGRIEIKQQLIENNDPSGIASYHFPDGTVEVIYEKNNDIEYSLLFRIHLKSDVTYNISSYLSLAEVSPKLDNP